MTQMDSDVLVIGGGPAGSTIAHRLAALGHSVVLLEQAEFPRRRIGESLTPGIEPILNTLGLSARMHAMAFFRPASAQVRWQNSLDTTAADMARAGYQVDRGRFDQMLLDAARDAGARVLQPAKARRIQHLARQHWHVDATTPHGKQQISARFLVDASGRGALLAPQCRRLSPPTLALYAYWQPQGDVGMESRVEAGEHGWFWGAPLPDGSFNAAVFLAPDHPLLKTRQPLEQIYTTLLQASPLLSACIRQRLGPVQSCSAGAYIDENPIGDDYIKVGDASFAIDPLSSQGVQAAMMSALQGSVVVHTLLREPAKGGAAQQFYRLRQRDTVQQHARWAAAAYAAQDRFPITAFWQKRSISSAPTITATAIAPRPISPHDSVCISPQAVWTEMPTLLDASVKQLPALSHPNLPSPVAFVAGVALFPVLALIANTDTLTSLSDKLSRFLPGELGPKLLAWLLQHHIIVAYPPQDI